MGKWVNCRIYGMDYLKNGDFTEDDLYNLFDTSSLTSSLILDMFRTIGDTRKDWEILKMTKTQTGWPDEYEWTYKQMCIFKDNLRGVFMNVYSFGEYTANIKAQWWLTYYGLKVKDNKRNKKRKKTADKKIA